MVWSAQFSLSACAQVELEDDGSGTVTILEAYRALITADFRPIRTVEFHWYSAEVRIRFKQVIPSLTFSLVASQEGGLLGSQAVAKHYEANGAHVLAMSQVIPRSQ